MFYYWCSYITKNKWWGGKKQIEMLTPQQVLYNALCCKVVSPSHNATFSTKWVVTYNILVVQFKTKINVPPPDVDTLPHIKQNNNMYTSDYDSTLAFVSGPGSTEMHHNPKCVLSHISNECLKQAYICKLHHIHSISINHIA